MTETRPVAARERTVAEFSLDTNFGWQRIHLRHHLFWFKGYEQSRSAETLAVEAAATGGDPVQLARWLGTLDGFFALAAEGPGWAMGAVDRIRSMPMIWAQESGKPIVTQDGPWLATRLGLDATDMLPQGAAALALAGFTIGSDTVFRGVRQLLPGEFLLARRAGIEVLSYHQWRPWEPDFDAEPGDLAAALSALHERLIQKLIDSAGGRRILVPLSAGLDSRMILSGLVEAGYGNVEAFAYGLAGNREAVVSRDVARRLGVPWSFRPYTNTFVDRVFGGADHRGYQTYADSLTGIHFPQDYPALRETLDEGRVSPDTIVVNGQSGDFITGNHVPSSLREPAHGDAKDNRETRVVEALVRKHFKNWRALQSPDDLAPIRERLSEEIAAIGGMPNRADADHGIYEYCEFIDRQSKYVVNGQRCYEFLGLGWRLPLWDRDYLDFWEKAPLGAKFGQKLYRQVLDRDNWGNVWRGDLPVNPLRVRPAWLVPLRLALKLLHAPLGRERWHRFETQYLSYWMAPLCSFAPWPWREVAFDRRGHASAMAWYAADYLNGKGIGWDGRLRDDR